MRQVRRITGVLVDLGRSAADLLAEVPGSRSHASIMAHVTSAGIEQNGHLGVAARIGPRAQSPSSPRSLCDVEESARPAITRWFEKRALAPVTCTAAARRVPYRRDSLPFQRHQCEHTTRIFMIVNDLLLHRVEKSS